MQNALLWIHIAAVAVWLGSNVLQAVGGSAMEKAGPGPHAAWVRLGVRKGLVLTTPAALLTLITGIELVRSTSVYDFSMMFVSLGFFTVIVGAALGMAVFGPVGRKLADAIDHGDHAAVRSLKAKLTLWGSLDTILVLITIYAMVAHLGR